MVPKIDIKATGKNIDRIRREKGLTVKDIQEYMGFAGVQAIYHWINGISLPNMDNMYILSELFEVSIDDILCGNKKTIKNNNINKSVKESLDSYSPRIWCYMDKLLQMCYIEEVRYTHGRQ